jgi:outer membrane lipoprotein SlyB
LLGNQVGGGSGKTAMTVLGVAGGAFAGNTIEKNMKKVTVYQMRVRMNDGSLRTIEQASAVQAGSRVIVEGHTLRLASMASSSAATYLSHSGPVA